MKKSKIFENLTIIEIDRIFLKNQDFSEIFIKILRDFDLGQTFRKSFFVKIFLKSQLLLQIFETLNFGQNFRKIQFWSKFPNITILV